MVRLVGPEKVELLLGESDPLLLGWPLHKLGFSKSRQDDVLLGH